MELEDELEEQLKKLILNVDDLKAKLLERKLEKSQIRRKKCQSRLRDFLTKNSQRKFRYEMSTLCSETSSLAALDIEKEMNRQTNTVIKNALTDMRKCFIQQCAILRQIERKVSEDVNSLDCAKKLLVDQLKVNFFVLMPDLEDALRLWLHCEIELYAAQCKLQYYQNCDKTADCGFTEKSNEAKISSNTNLLLAMQSETFYSKQIDVSNSIQLMDQKILATSSLLKDAISELIFLKSSTLELSQVVGAISKNAVAVKLSGADFCTTIAHLPSEQIEAMWKNDSREIVFVLDSSIFYLINTDREKTREILNGPTKRPIMQIFTHKNLDPSSTNADIENISGLIKTFLSERGQFLDFCQKLEADKFEYLKQRLQRVYDEHLHSKRLAFLLSH